jgi:sarcosine oxidase, subunit beta
MVTTADVIVVGAGVQGASLAFHLARQGARVLILERESIAAGATGRSSGFVRMHYDLESDARLAAASFPYFREWAERVGSGDCGFVRTGFVQLVPSEQEDVLRANVDMLQGLGIDTCVVARDELERIVPGIAAPRVGGAAYEPQSGYADPAGTAAGFIGAAREHGARFIQGCRVDAVTVDGERVSGVETDRGAFVAPVVVDVAGAWAPRLAETVGVKVPVVPWRHDTAFFGLPSSVPGAFPIVIDNENEVYFRPEGRDLMLVGLEIGNDVGGSPDRDLAPIATDTVALMAARVCARVPWMIGGTYRTAHGGQDGITPDQRPIIGPAGPDGFFLACGFSGTGFKTAPAVGAALAELILNGVATTADISAYGLDRFEQGRSLVGEHPYGALWR